MSFRGLELFISVFPYEHSRIRRLIYVLAASKGSASLTLQLWHMASRFNLPQTIEQRCLYKKKGVFELQREN